MQLRFNWLRPKSLFGKYVVTFVGLVVFVLATSSAVDMWLSFRNTKDSLLRAQAEKADTAAARVEQFLAELERQVSWATRASSVTSEQRRSDYTLILEHTPAVVAMTQVDGSGKELVRVTPNGSTFRSGADYAQADAFKAAASGVAWFGPIYFTSSGPYMQVSMAHSGRNAGVTIAEVNLKFLSEILNGIQAGSDLYAYIVADGRLIAHTNATLAERNIDMRSLPQVVAYGAAHSATPAPPIDIGRNLDGQSVLTAAALVPRMNWSVFFEQPVSQAFGPVYELLFRTLWLFLLSIVLCVAAGTLLARRMTVPIKALETGASRIAAGEFDHQIKVRTGDELEALAEEFNHMATQLRESYGRLEQKVEERTKDLAQSISELKALEEVGRTLAASLNIEEVLAAIATRAVELTKADGGAIYRFDANRNLFKLAGSHALEASYEKLLGEVRRSDIEALLARQKSSGAPIQLPDLQEIPPFPLRDMALAAGFHSLLIVPLASASEVLGALVVTRRTAGAFPASTIGLMQTFAHQCVLALHNAKLFREIDEKSKQLALANEHKSQFFANMSHELRTPLNAVLGYTELLQDGLYGEIPERAHQVLERVQANGTHLLGLINDVLDLSKIEAGELDLVVDNYSMRAVIESVAASAGSLAQAKSLSLTCEIASDLPLGYGDERRLSQVLLNLVSNAIKFTEQGGVTIHAKAAGDRYEVAVEDTGPGIAPEDQMRIFEAFQQVDNSSTKYKGGTGLGLSISKRFVEMHGGMISVQSVLGSGATFRISLPVSVKPSSVQMDQTA
jgi:signal transduction histidine kinase